MKTIAIIEGFSGGPMHTRRFRRALTTAGFKVIKDRYQADIIIAHSAGIYAVPRQTKAKLLVLIGPTYWPGVPLIARSARHRRSSGRHRRNNFGWRYLLWTRLLEIYYFFRRHIYMWYGILNNNRLDHLSQLIDKPGRKTIIIRNHDDPFTSPEIKRALRHKNLQYVELPGVHDDFVTNPEPYVNLIQSEHARG